jgi:3-oxoacyl-[acyl-carrier protein] reductase
MTRAAAIELGSIGVTVNAVAPGPVQAGYINEALAEKVLTTIPLRRLGCKALGSYIPAQHASNNA